MRPMFLALALVTAVTTVSCGERIPLSFSPATGSTLRLGDQWKVGGSSKLICRSGVWGLQLSTADGATVRVGAMNCEGSPDPSSRSTIGGELTANSTLYQFGKSQMVTVSVALAPDSLSLRSGVNMTILPQPTVKWVIAE